MSEEIIRCKITGHQDGPPCEECGEPMDSITVEDKGHQFDGRTGHYCFPCTERGRKR